LSEFVLSCYTADTRQVRGAGPELFALYLQFNQNLSTASSKQRCVVHIAQQLLASSYGTQQRELLAQRE